MVLEVYIQHRGITNPHPYSIQLLLTNNQTNGLSHIVILLFVHFSYSILDRRRLVSIGPSSDEFLATEGLQDFLTEFRKMFLSFSFQSRNPMEIVEDDFIFFG